MKKKLKIIKVSMLEAIGIWERNNYTFIYDLDTDEFDPSTEATTMEELACALESGAIVRVYKDVLASKAMMRIKYKGCRKCLR